MNRENLEAYLRILTAEFRSSGLDWKLAKMNQDRTAELEASEHIRIFYREISAVRADLELMP